MVYFGVFREADRGLSKDASQKHGQHQEVQPLQPATACNRNIASPLGLSPSPELKQTFHCNKSRGRAMSSLDFFSGLCCRSLFQQALAPSDTIRSNPIHHATALKPLTPQWLTATYEIRGLTAAKRLSRAPLQVGPLHLVEAAYAVCRRPGASHPCQDFEARPSVSALTSSG